ncbi:26129_t:CDS:2 [Gigaspora margarita]|uniref:26129_t:CDS:1 n=1 Tax=Gigaspora margarita TaxID=4874 RepID=A0ABM8W6M1_GIGMA|nr:26129_t:CDS:2 [Gigaspora margarita]
MSKPKGKRSVQTSKNEQEGTWNYKEFDPIISDGLNKLNAKSLSNTSPLNGQLSSSPTQPAQSFLFNITKGPLDPMMQISFDQNAFLQNIVSFQLGQTTLQEFYSPLDQFNSQELLSTNPAVYTVPFQLDQNNVDNILLICMQLEQSTNHIQKMRNLLNKVIQELTDCLNREVQMLNNNLSQEIREIINTFLNQKVQKLDLSLNNEVQELKSTLTNIIQNYI